MTFGTMKVANLMRLGPRNLRISSERGQSCFHHSYFVYSCLIATDDGIQFGDLPHLEHFGDGCSYNYLITWSSEKLILFMDILRVWRFAILSN
jgi:hypothetical protein